MENRKHRAVRLLFEFLIKIHWETARFVREQTQEKASNVAWPLFIILELYILIVNEISIACNNVSFRILKIGYD